VAFCVNNLFKRIKTDRLGIPQLREPPDPSSALRGKPNWRVLGSIVVR